jgi:hypothetical protein
MNEQKTAETAEEGGPQLSANLERIRQRVDALEDAAAERKTPWYQQAANWVSLLAIIAAVGGVVYQVHFEARDRQYEELQQIAVDIVDTRKAIGEAMTAQSATINGTQVYLLTKAQILLARGVNLMRSLKRDIPAEVLYILGTEASMNGQFAEARDIYKATGKTISEPYELQAKEGLGAVYLLPGTGITDINQGEALFGEALSYVEKRRDPQAAAWIGLVHWVWGNSEFAAGRSDQAFAQYTMAEQSYQSLPVTNANRANGLQAARQSRGLVIQASEAGRSPAQNLSGVWASKGEIGGSYGVAVLAITMDSASGAIGATGSLFPTSISAATPCLTMAGLLQMQDLQTLVMHWTGTARLSRLVMAELPANGTTTLALSKDATSMEALLEQPSAAPVHFSLTRLQAPEASKAVALRCAIT